MLLFPGFVPSFCSQLFFPAFIRMKALCLKSALVRCS
jgi:hypothetical protein